MAERAKNVAAFGQRPGNLKTSLTASFGYLEWEESPPPGPQELEGSFFGDLRFFFHNVTQHSVPVDIGLIDSKRDAQQDAGFETSVIISLFTDRRASDDDELPDESGYKGGWAGDQVLNDLFSENLILGSRLWLLYRAVMNNDLLVQSKEFCEEALSWMILFNIDQKVIVTTSRADDENLYLDIEIIRPPAEELSYRYLFNWTAQIAKGI